MQHSAHTHTHAQCDKCGNVHVALSMPLHVYVSHNAHGAWTWRTAITTMSDCVRETGQTVCIHIYSYTFTHRSTAQHFTYMRSCGVCDRWTFFIGHLLFRNSMEFSSSFTISKWIGTDARTTQLFLLLFLYVVAYFWILNRSIFRPKHPNCIEFEKQISLVVVASRSAYVSVSCVCVQCALCIYIPYFDVNNWIR